MRKHIASVVIFASLLVAACNVPAQQAPAALTAASPTPTEAAPTEPTSAPATEAAPAAEMAPAEAGAIPVEALMNATYSGIYEEPVTLTDGGFEEQPFTVQYVDGEELYGDLDGDGIEDAVVFLIERGGGTAAFTYVGAQLKRDGQPVDAGAAMVEDRTQILSAAIEDGQIKLEITTRGPGDGDCCPSYRTSRTYALQDGQLAEVAGEDQEPVRISAADLNGTSWNLLEMDYDTPALADAVVTISFQDDQISGSGGCNRYNSSFSLSEDNPFVITVGPVVSTQMACPEPILDQEAAYLTALEDVVRWGYVFGRLALYYAGHQGFPARLLFAPQAADAEMETTEAVDTASSAVGDAAAIEATFVCPGGTSIDAVFDNAAGTVTVTLPDGAVTLPRVVSASGARYSDGQITFWNKGNEALVEVNGETVYASCSVQE